MKSIRTSLIVGSVLGTVAVFALSAIAIYRGAETVLIGQLDRGLEDQARVIASVVKLTPEGMEVEIEDIDVPEFTSPAGHGYLQLWLDADSVMYRSRRLSGQSLEVDRTLSLNRPAFRWTRVGDGVHARAVSLRTHSVVDSEDWEEVGLPMPPPVVIDVVAAMETTATDAFLARLKTLLVAVCALGGLVVAGVLAAVVRGSLRPLDHLAREIGKLGDSGDLSARVRIPVTPREMEPVVAQLNQLLERLDAAFQRERTFSSDIAHELRTPLAGLRSTVEVALSRSRDAEDYRETLAGLLAIIHKIQDIMETLLYLGRLEAGQVEIERRDVDLGDLVKASWAPLAEAARARRLAVSWNVPRTVEVTADPILLEVAIRNVLDNAVSYTNEGGYVRVEIDGAGTAGSLRVANSGSNVAPEAVGDLLRRFTRADTSRAASGRHVGLGLALAHRIATVLGWSLHIDSRVGGEFVVTLSADRIRPAR
jgi:two-component system, OmpR family, heavy metal sensor histidine kinase CusS